MRARKPGPSFIRTGLYIERGVERLEEIYQSARTLCPDDFPAEETRELPALYDRVSLAYIDSLRAQLAATLSLPKETLSRDRFSVQGCGPVGLHDDFFRFPHVYFVVIVAHAGRLGLVDETCVAVPHRAGEIILLDPRRKHGLVRVGTSAEQHRYDQSHAPVHEPEDQFLFLDFDVRRPDLRPRFRQGRCGAPRETS